MKELWNAFSIGEEVRAKYIDDINKILLFLMAVSMVLLLFACVDTERKGIYIYLIATLALMSISVISYKLYFKLRNSGHIKCANVLKNFQSLELNLCILALAPCVLALKLINKYLSYNRIDENLLIRAIMQLFLNLCLLVVMLEINCNYSIIVALKMEELLNLDLEVQALSILMVLFFFKLELEGMNLALKIFFDLTDKKEKGHGNASNVKEMFLKTLSCNMFKEKDIRKHYLKHVSWMFQMICIAVLFATIVFAPSYFVFNDIEAQNIAQSAVVNAISFISIVSLIFDKRKAWRQKVINESIYFKANNCNERG